MKRLIQFLLKLYSITQIYVAYLASLHTWQVQTNTAKTMWKLHKLQHIKSSQEFIQLEYRDTQPQNKHEVVPELSATLYRHWPPPSPLVVATAALKA